MPRQAFPYKIPTGGDKLTKKRYAFLATRASREFHSQSNSFLPGAEPPSPPAPNSAVTHISTTGLPGRRVPVDCTAEISRSPSGSYSPLIQKTYLGTLGRQLRLRISAISPDLRTRAIASRIRTRRPRACGILWMQMRWKWRLLLAATRK